MKIDVKYIRSNLSHNLWDYTQAETYLHENNWTKYASKKLLDFENDILKTMKRDGWDGVENPERLQWTRMGALFYSIIVITTIGKKNNFKTSVIRLNYYQFIEFLVHILND